MGHGALGIASLGCGPEAMPPGDASRFPFGVASADPRPDALALWTRVVPVRDGETIRLEVSQDPDFRDVLRSADLVADSDAGGVVHAEATGLEPGCTYYYRFLTADSVSAVGETRSAPSGGPVRLAFTCCASYAHGYFHTYRRIAERSGLDAVVHLGDYIYEYGDGEYGDLRGYDPPEEVLSLSDYRRRYAHYRLDPDLANLHQRHPMVVTWDDHELANNAWAGGAAEHDPTREGSWSARRVAAERAHREWLPRHEPHPGSLFRRLPFGDVDLFVLDTRLEGRDAPPTSDAEAASPERSILGAPQRERFLQALRASTATWKVVAHAVQLAPHHQSFWNHDAWDGYAADRQRVLEAVRSIEGVIFVCGDGHKIFADDVPLALASYDPRTGDGSVAVEVMTPAATSPNLFGDAARAFEARVRESSPHTHFIEAESRGYWVIDLDDREARFELSFVDGIEDPRGGEQRSAARFVLPRGSRSLRRTDR